MRRCVSPSTSLIRIPSLASTTDEDANGIWVAGEFAGNVGLRVDPEEMHMVGDDLNNDVLAAQVVGMVGVLVRTGKFRQDTLDRWAADEYAMQPNHVIDSVADLPGLLGL